MKNFTLLFFVLLAGTSFAQPSNSEICDSIYYWKLATDTTWNLAEKDDDLVYDGDKLKSKIHYHREATKGLFGTTGSNVIWTPVGMEIKSYDDAGNMLSYLKKEYVAGNWENVSITTNTYDDNNNKLTQVDQLWDNGIWQNEYQLFYTYDDWGNMLTVLGQYPDSITVWVNNKWTEMTYNENNQRLTTFAQMWRNNEWDNWYNYLCEYDELDRLSFVHNKSWYQNDWSIQHKTYYHYTGDNLDTIRRIELEDGEWQDNSLTMHNYDDSGRRVLTTELIYLFDQWYNHSRETYHYDSRGNMYHSFLEFCDFVDWQPVFRFWNTYNEDNICVDYSFIDYQLNTIRGDSTHLFLKNPVGISEIEVGDQKSDLQISVFPNPTTGLFTISNINSIKGDEGKDQYSEWPSNLRSLDLFTLSGTRQPVSVSGSGIIDISHLPVGIYLLRINVGNDVVVTKVIKDL